MDQLAFELQMERTKRAIEASDDRKELKEIALALTNLVAAQRGMLMTWIYGTGEDQSP